MNSIPVDVDRMGSTLVTAITPDVDDEGVHRHNREDIPLWRVEVLLRPQVGPSGRAPRASVEVVKIASETEPDIEPMAEVVFFGLVARPWVMGTRSGVSLSADGVIGGDAA